MSIGAFCFTISAALITGLITGKQENHVSVTSSTFSFGAGAVFPLQLLCVSVLCKKTPV